MTQKIYQIFKNDKCFIPYTVKVTESTANIIEKISAEKKCTRSDVIRTALSFWLNYYNLN